MGCQRPDTQPEHWHYQSYTLVNCWHRCYPATPFQNLARSLNIEIIR